MPLGMLGRGLVPTPPAEDGGNNWGFRGTGVQRVKEVLNFEVEPHGANHHELTPKSSQMGSSKD